MARGIHLFPFRTESLSPSAPMVLGGKLPGRVGRRRNYLQKATPQGVAFCRSGRLRRAWPAAAFVASASHVAASPAGLRSGDVLPVGCCRPRGAFPQSQAVRGLRRAVIDWAAPAGVQPFGGRRPVEAARSGVLPRQPAGQGMVMNVLSWERGTAGAITSTG